jgi:hypothetical protein
MHQRIPLTREVLNAQSTRLGCWFVGQGSARRGYYHQTGMHKWTVSLLEGSTYRESSTPHHTPMPATDPSCPFPEHAPSVYTTSSAVADILDCPGAVCDLTLGRPGATCDSEPDSKRDWLEAAGLTVDEDEGAGIRPLGSDPIEVLVSLGEWFAGLIFCFTGYGTARCIQASASSRVPSFLYLAQG